MPKSNVIDMATVSAADGRGDASIILLDKFIQATRDSGYKGTPSAVAELVDNSIQAGATRINVSIVDLGRDTRFPLQISVWDNGCGMDASTLRQALRFGGSTRFDDRNSLGRYGMGLPNSSLNQARRVDVFTRQEGQKIVSSHLDVDEIAKGKMKVVPKPEVMEDPHGGFHDTESSGTTVAWSRCDRLDNKRPSTIARKLAVVLGRVFRHFIWDGIEITINEAPIIGIDPLFLHPDSPTTGARQFSDTVEYEIEHFSVETNAMVSGKVLVRFTELPVEKFHDLPNKDKRRMGISTGAGVSIVRAGREIDYGWFFLGGKRRENYDDWWRCEVRFEPVLDEAFGITHTKQQVRPSGELIKILAPDIEETARALSVRARKAHATVKAQVEFSESIEKASSQEGNLRPLPELQQDQAVDDEVKEFLDNHPVIKDMVDSAKDDETKLLIAEGVMKKTHFFDFARTNGQLLVLINPEHPFYKKCYKPLADSSDADAKSLKGQIDLILLAAARSEALSATNRSKDHVAQFRADWSDTLARYLKD